MDDPLIESLPPVQRLALAYAPASARLPWLALLALDSKLAGIVRAAREPMLAQIRLAWWRERLEAPAEGWPKGQPVLRALASWEGRHGALVGLVDGWEALLGETADGSVCDALANARGNAVAALARVLGEEGPEAARMGGCWAAADIAAHLSRPAMRETALVRAAARDWRPARLPRSMRPLVVLHGLAARQRHGAPGVRTLLVGIRLGILGS